MPLGGSMGERGPKGRFSDISCNNPDCIKYGKIGEDNIVGNGTYEARGRISQRYYCKVCGHYFNTGSDTAYDGLRTDSDKVDRVIKCLNEGMGVRATARTVGCSISTVQRWRNRAAKQAHLMEMCLEQNLEPTCVQFNEMVGTLKKNPS